MTPLEQAKDKDKEEDKMEGEIKKYVADAAKRISKVIHEEDTKRKEIKNIGWLSYRSKWTWENFEGGYLKNT